MTAAHADPNSPATPGIASTSKFHGIGRAKPGPCTGG